MFKKLSALLTRRDKQYLFGLVLFSIVISVIETVGISAVMPLISIATDFNVIHSNKYISMIYNFFNFSKEVDFVISFGIVLIIFYILRSIINLIYFYLLNKFSQGRYHLLAYRLFENYLGMSYHEFVKKNSSTLTKSIINEAANLTALIGALLFMISEIFVVIILYGMMLYVNYKITLLLTLILAINALFLTKSVSKKIKQAGVKRADIQRRFYEIINRSFGNFKLIKLQSEGKKVLDEFAKSSYDYAHANIVGSTLKQVPRFFLEAIGFGLIAFIVTYLVWKYEDNISSALGIVSMFVLALYRLLPSVNRIMSGYNQIMFKYIALDIVHNDLMYDNEDLGSACIVFNRSINIQNLSFGYEADMPILNDINLTIEKGSSIAFIGDSGSGKSTLVDLIIGLYRPVEGKIVIDETMLSDDNIKQWRKKIGYIPQNVYLFDGTVGENIVFGREYDQTKIDVALKKAKIYDFLATKKGSHTVVGEGGIMLSGGQKQRIAIARALYGDPDILVLDEATSALDNETEEHIMDEIYEASTDKTLIIIAHRLSTIDRCDKIYRLENGKVYEQ